MAVYISPIASITPQICSEQATRQSTTTTISERPKMRTYPPPAQPNRDDSEHAERAINQAPPERNSPDRAEHERIRDHQRARDHAEGEQPAVAHRVTQGADESNGNREMPECPPVSFVEHERVARAGLVQPPLHPGKPESPTRRAG